MWPQTALEQMFKVTGYGFVYLFPPSHGQKAYLNQVSFTAFHHHAETPTTSRPSPVPHLEQRHQGRGKPLGYHSVYQLKMRVMLMAKAKPHST